MGGLLNTCQVCLVAEPLYDCRRRLEKLGVWRSADRYLRGAEGYYWPRRDAAIIGLRFQDELVGSLGSSGLAALFSPSRVQIIRPPALSEADLYLFGRCLARYPVYVQRFVYRDDEGRDILAHLCDSLVESAFFEKRNGPVILEPPPAAEDCWEEAKTTIREIGDRQGVHRANTSPLR